MREWIVERTVCTHNHPSRFWETSVLDPIAGLVARSSSDSEEGSKQLARLIAASQELLEALKDLAIREPLCDDGDPALTAARNAAWAAIAKAEGK